MDRYISYPARVVPLTPVTKNHPVIPILLWVLILLPGTLFSQGVSEIITDFNGYWKSGTGNINATKPNNSHNLLSFTYNGARYSTGANDSLLTARGNTFTAADFKALPISQLTGKVNGNTKIGLGEMYDGVHNGASNPAPANNMALYLTDGIKGLDLGTCVANLPAGDLFFPISNLKAAAINDGIPDMLITQVADPSSSSLDSYEFTDINGNRVGNKVDIVLNTLPVVGNWTVDFYEAEKNPMTLSGGYTNTDRAIRLWVADFNSFGINSSNISQVAYFKIRLNGNSDVAFVAYNNNTFNIMNNPLPVQLTHFTGTVAGKQVDLDWATASEFQADRFVIETGTDGVHFDALDSVAASGTSFVPHRYHYRHQHPGTGKQYYRLKETDINGRVFYSNIVQVNLATTTITFSAWPNPVVDMLTVTYPKAAGNEVCRLIDSKGTVWIQQTCKAGSIQQTFNLQALPKGVYYMVCSNGSEKLVKAICKQ